MAVLGWSAPAKAEDSTKPVEPPQAGVFQAALQPMKSAADAMMKGSQMVGLKIRDEVLKVRELFDMVLPGPTAKHRWVLDFEPKAGDLVKREFMRWPMDLRYGVSEHWEAYGGMTPVSPNPFKAGPDHRWSPGMGTLGLRHDLEPGNTWLFKQVTVGFEVLEPLGEPPVDLIDHYTHLRPYVTTASPLTFVRDTTLFVSMSYDYSVMGPSRRDVPAGVVKRHIAELAPGFLYKPGEYGLFFQYGLRHLDEPEGYRLTHYGKLGVLWDVPLRRSKRWGVSGKWQFELGYKVSDEEGYSPRHGVHARVKWTTDLFRRKWENLKK